MNAIDKIFLPYKGQTIEMDFSPGSIFAEIVSKLENILGSDKVIGFMMGPVLDYANKFNIEFIEPEDDITIDPIDLQRRVNKPKMATGFDDERVRMKYLAGLNESDDEEKEDWKKTSWENEKGQKITISQLLNVIKDYPIIQAPIEKVKKIVIKKDTGGIESNRLDKANTQYPIIIVVDSSNNYKYILDGNHRANKAIDNKEKTIPAKLVDINKLPKNFQDVLNEEKEVKESFKKDQMLTFNSEEDRDLALEWLRESNNYPKEVKKYVPSRLYYKPEDAVSILFPTYNNLNEGLDEKKFIGIVEILHRAINKNIPNSRTIKVKDNG